MSTVLESPPVWLSQAQAAEYFGVTDRTIRSYIARGLLPASRIRGSKQIRIRRTDLDAMLRPIPTVRSTDGEPVKAVGDG